MAEPDRSADTSRVPALDLLRLAAVGAVILYHYGFWGPDGHQVALPALAPIAQYGYLGVPVFFAISGFVIAYSAEGRSPVSFAIARFSRIYPTFVFCMTLTFVATVLLGFGHFRATMLEWLANLFVAAPMLSQPYLDGAYWSLVIEIVFYGWVAVFMALGLFPRRLDGLIMAWLALTFANELTIDAPIFEKLFIADDSGFFAVGLLIYQHHRGRRGLRFWALSILALGTALFQAIHQLERLGVHTHGTFDPKVVAAICVISLGVVLLATRIRHVPLPGALVLAIGGLTYPLYLLHMQLGYVLLNALNPGTHVAAWTTAIIGGCLALSFGVWRYVDRPLHAWTKSKLTKLARRQDGSLVFSSRAPAPGDIGCQHAAPESRRMPRCAHEEKAGLP